MIGHRSPISGVAALDDRYIATAGYDNRILLWDQATRTPVAAANHDHLVNQCEFSPDGTRLASASSDATMRVWTVPDLRPVAVAAGHDDDVEKVAFSPDGHRIATASRDSVVRVFSIAGEPLAELRGHRADVLSVRWTPDGRHLVSSSDDGTVKRWDVGGATLVDDVDLGDVEVDAIAVSRDGAVFVGDDTGAISIIGRHGHTRIRSHAAGVKCLLYDARRQRLHSSSYDGNIVCYDVSDAAQPRLVDTIPIDPHVWPRSMTVTASGRLIAGTFGNRYAEWEPLARRWDLGQGTEAPGINAVTLIDGVAWSVGDSGVVARELTPVQLVGSPCYFLTPWSDDIYTGGHSGQIFEVRSGRVVYRHQCPINRAIVVARDDGDVLVAATYTGEALVLRRDRGHLRCERRIALHDNAIKGLAHDGETLFSVCATGAAAWHRIVDWSVVRRAPDAHTKIANDAVTIGPAHFASVSRDRKLRRFQEGRASTVDTGHQFSVKCLAVCTHTSLVATGSYGGEVFLIRDDEVVARHRPTSSGISSIVAAGRAGHFLVGSFDGNLYDVSTGDVRHLGLPLASSDSGSCGATPSGNLAGTAPAERMP